MLKGRPNKENADKVDKRKSRIKESSMSLTYISKGIKANRQLGKYGNLEFLRITRALLGSKVISEIDLSLLESACKMYDAHCQLEDNMLDVNDRFDTTPNGTMVLSAWSIESKRCLEMYTKIVLQFGVTPLARMRITTTPKGDSAMEDFEKQYGS